VEAHENVNEVEGAGNTPLHCAAYEGWAEGVQLLLSLGAKVNASNNAGDRPWHWARNMDRPDVMELLERVRSGPVGTSCWCCQLLWRLCHCLLQEGVSPPIEQSSGSECSPASKVTCRYHAEWREQRAGTGDCAGSHPQSQGACSAAVLIVAFLWN